MFQSQPWMTIQLTKKSHWNNHKPNKLLSVFLCPFFANFSWQILYYATATNLNSCHTLLHLTTAWKAKQSIFCFLIWLCGFSDLALQILPRIEIEIEIEIEILLSNKCICPEFSQARFSDKIRQHKHAVTSIGFPQSCIISTPTIFPHKIIQINFGRFSSKLP